MLKNESKFKELNKIYSIKIKWICHARRLVFIFIFQKKILLLRMQNFSILMGAVILSYINYAVVELL